HPIVGDRTYGAKAKWAEQYGIERPLLHARSIELEHPDTGDRVQFGAPWPADMKRALEQFRRAGKVALLWAVLWSGGLPAHAEDSSGSSSAKHKSAGTSSSSTGPTLHSLHREMASLRDQFKSLIVEVSALQDKVSSLQTNLDELEASRRLRDLEKAISDLNGKAVGSSNIGEETKSQVLEQARKLKEHQDALDQLRDQ